MDIINEKPFAEIIESNNAKYLAQTWNPQVMPKFGQLVETINNNTKIFGIITSIQTGSQDPMRYPFTYKKTEEELIKEQPQIFEFLKTTFDVQIVGFQANDKIIYSLPSNPPKIHSFVNNLDKKSVQTFFNKTDFLYLLFNSQIHNLDEILIAILNDLPTNKIFLTNFCNNFSLLSGNDYKRLKLFLSRIKQI
jgi:hypothetical protein